MPQHEGVVYVIDDEEPIREALTFLLESEELEVRTYDSGNEFLQALPQDLHGCIVTDIRMPGVSGIELLRQIRTLGVTVPVIVISGHADVPLVVEAMKSGAVDFLEKPFDDDTFLSAVRSALRQTTASAQTLAGA